MRQRSNYINNKDQPRFCLKGILGWCFAFFFGFFFLFTQISQFASSQIEEWEIQDNSSIFSSARLVAGDHETGHLPFGKGQSPAEPKSTHESESNDSFDDSFGTLISNLFTEDKFILNSVKCLLSNLLLSIENRSKISLVILHHSWKSFLI